MPSLKDSRDNVLPGWPPEDLAAGNDGFTEIFELAEPGQGFRVSRGTGCDRRADPVLHHSGAAIRCCFRVAQRFTNPR